MDWEIYTVGGIQYLTQIYKGLILFVGDSTFHTYLKLAGALGIIIGSIMLLYTHRASYIIRSMVWPLLFGSLLIGMKTDVIIVDTKYAKAEVVNNAPLGVAVIHSALSKLSYYITKSVSNIFLNSPDGIIHVYAVSGVPAGEETTYGWATYGEKGENTVPIHVGANYTNMGYAGIVDLAGMAYRMNFYDMGDPCIRDFARFMDGYMERCVVWHSGFYTDLSEMLRKSGAIIKTIKYEPGSQKSAPLTFPRDAKISCACAKRYGIDTSPDGRAKYFIKSGENGECSYMINPAYDMFFRNCAVAWRQVIEPMYNNLFVNMLGLTPIDELVATPEEVEWQEASETSWDDLINQFNNTALGKVYNSLGFKPDDLAKFALGTDILIGSQAKLADKIFQAAIMKSIYNGYERVMMESPRGAEILAYKAAEAQRLEQYKQMGKTSAIYARQIMPLMKIVMEAIYIIFLPIMILFILATNNGQMVKGFLIAMAWIAMWDPIMAVLDGIVNITAIEAVKTKLMSQHVYGLFSPATLIAMRDSLDTIEGIAGYLSLSAPVLAWMIMKGGTQMVSGVFHLMSATTTGFGLTTTPHATTLGPVAGQVGQMSQTMRMAEMHRTPAGMLATLQFTQPWKLAETIYSERALEEMGPDYGKWAYTGAHESLGKADYIMEHGGGKFAEEMGYYKTRGEHVGAETQKLLEDRGITVDRLANANVIGEEKRIGEMEKFSEIAQSFGGVESFARMIAAKDYAGMAHMISLYAEATNQDYESAAAQLGAIMSDKELLSAQGYQNAVNTIGRSNVLFTEINKYLNEAAKFENTYRFAHLLGFAGDRNDYRGIYNAHLAHHAQETYTLDKQRAENLNNLLGSMGYQTSFHAGDRVTMAMDGNKITLASGQAGAHRMEFDFADISRGLRNMNYDVSQSVYGRGEKIDFGNDMVAVAMTGDASILKENYSQFFADTTLDPRENKFIYDFADIISSFGQKSVKMETEKADWSYTEYSKSTGGAGGFGKSGLGANTGIYAGIDARKTDREMYQDELEVSTQANKLKMDYIRGAKRIMTDGNISSAERMERFARFTQHYTYLFNNLSKQRIDHKGR